MEDREDQGIIQSPSNRKSYKTFKGATDNLFGFGDPEANEKASTPDCKVLEALDRTFFLVDISAAAREVVKNVQAEQLTP